MVWARNLESNPYLAGNKVNRRKLSQVVHFPAQGFEQILRGKETSKNGKCQDRLFRYASGLFPNLAYLLGAMIRFWFLVTFCTEIS
jgi:hypothetical protein